MSSLYEVSPGTNEIGTSEKVSAFASESASRYVCNPGKPSYAVRGKSNARYVDLLVLLVRADLQKTSEFLKHASRLCSYKVRHPEGG